ncbi:hypothetical protein BSL78_23157 [Apostichopus japonicus]|uniref:Uncharacterized protein n=1 Tax=Stichopus japonicus TaxID=307972 RepID=A0A2G8JW88_STIJA|nr:hypothetical protein BSL78_23157 [Apostichopus japonicus]
MNSSSVNSEFRRSEKGNSEEYFCQCPVQSEIYNFRSAALCLSSHFLCGTVSCAVSMATIWLESFAAGAGVFLGSYNLVSWGGNVRKEDAHRIDVLIRQASRIIGDSQPTLASSYQHQLGVKLEKILLDEDHPVREFLDRAIIPRSGRMRLPLARTNRHPLFIHFTMHETTQPTS